MSWAASLAQIELDLMRSVHLALCQIFKSACRDSDDTLGETHAVTDGENSGAVVVFSSICHLIVTLVLRTGTSSVEGQSLLPANATSTVPHQNRKLPPTKNGALIFESSA